ncbi:MAG: redoxin domain-containing protein [Dehalococcoidia bacterium]|nr:redoxin domain-containing protein [Dehalococcoidia bacterium]
MSETATLKVGDEAPDFELPSSPTGEKFKLSDYEGKNAVVINFVPAAFSPACSNQMPLIEKKREEFASQDALPVVISSDGVWAQAAWKKELGLEFPILSDFAPLGTRRASMASSSSREASRTGSSSSSTSTGRSPGSSRWRRSPTCRTTTRCSPVRRTETSSAKTQNREGPPVRRAFSFGGGEARIRKRSPSG